MISKFEKRETRVLTLPIFEGLKIFFSLQIIKLEISVIKFPLQKCCDKEGVEMSAKIDWFFHRSAVLRLLQTIPKIECRN